MQDTRGQYLAAIRPLREAANMTQLELSRMVGVSTQSVRMWERGYVFPAARHRIPLERLFPELAAIRVKQLRAKVGRAVTHKADTAGAVAMTGMYGCVACELHLVPDFLRGLF